MNSRLLHFIKAFVCCIRIFSWIRLLGILMCILFLESNGYCQQQKGFDLSKIYNTALDKYLLHSSNCPETIIFLEKPSFDPEHVIRVKTFKDSIILEECGFKENYFMQLVRQITEYKSAEFEPEISHYSIIVSERFKKKLQQMFSQTINSKPLYTSDEMPVDGTTYLFKLCGRDSSALEIHEPRKDDIAYRSASICVAIATSLRNNNLNEMKIMKAMEASGF